MTYYESQTTYKMYEDMTEPERKAIIVDVIAVASRLAVASPNNWQSLIDVKRPTVLKVEWRNPNRGDTYISPVEGREGKTVEASGNHAAPQWVVVR